MRQRKPGLADPSLRLDAGTEPGPEGVTRLRPRALRGLVRLVETETLLARELGRILGTQRAALLAGAAPEVLDAAGQVGRLVIALDDARRRRRALVEAATGGVPLAPGGTAGALAEAEAGLRAAVDVAREETEATAVLLRRAEVEWHVALQRLLADPARRTEGPPE